MKLILTIDVEPHRDWSWVTIRSMQRTIAEDVANMLNEKHEDVYRTTTLYREASEG